MKDIECPYCGAEQEINHDDGYGYAEDITFQQTCFSCEKIFIFNTTISFHYDVATCDCLNEGGNHNWKPTITYPKRYTKMRCTMCDEERTPTENELELILSNG